VDVLRIIAAQPMHSLKVGGEGMRYTCIINSRRTYLYFDGKNRWYMEV
jgi:hypothetical protein